MDSEDLTNLATSVTGTKHFFAWDFEADSSLAMAADVGVRLTIRNAYGPATVESDLLTVDTSRWGVPCSCNPARSVGAPEI